MQKVDDLKKQSNPGSDGLVTQAYESCLRYNGPIEVEI